MKAINDVVVVKDIKGEQKKIAGLIMTEDTDTENRYKKAEIITCGAVSYTHLTLPTILLV